MNTVRTDIATLRNALYMRAGTAAAAMQARTRALANQPSLAERSLP